MPFAVSTLSYLQLTLVGKTRLSAHAAPIAVSPNPRVIAMSSEYAKDPLMIHFRRMNVFKKHLGYIKHA
jgi:hypothetical protein